MNENIELMMPIKSTPYEHQKKSFAFACDKFGVCDNRLKSRGTALLIEMGTGKTSDVLDCGVLFFILVHFCGTILGRSIANNYLTQTEATLQ